MDKYLKLSFGNRSKIESSFLYGCYHCINLFMDKNIQYLKEKDGSETGICPNCGIDSLLDSNTVSENGDALNYGFLKKLHKVGFE